MRNLKKILSLVLAMMMVLSLMVTASATTFVDDEEITYKEAVEVMAGLGVLTGVKNEDGSYNFLPKEKLNRAAGAKIVAYIANGGTLDKDLMATLDNPFTDVAGWAVDSVKYCYSQGIINGISADKFDPSNALDGYAFGKMMLQAAGYDWQSANGSNWKTKVLMTLKSNGLLTGIEDLVFSQPMTREQACQMAFNIMKQAPDSAVLGYYIKLTGTMAAGGQLYKNIIFETRTEALVYGNALPGLSGTFGATNGWTIAEATDGTGSLLLDNFSITRDPIDVDAFGNPGTSYYRPASKGYVYLFFQDNAMKTYDAGFNTNTYNALLAAGYDFTGCEVVVNGETTVLTAAAIAGRAYTGTTVALYNHLDGNARTVDRLVLTQSYLTEVTNVVSTNKTATSNFITLKVYNPWHAADVVSVTYHDDASTVSYSKYDYLVANYGKGDLFLSYWLGGDVAAANLLDWEDVSDSFVGTVTATKMTGAADGFNGTFVANGTTYTLASGYAEYTNFGGALTLGKEYTFVTDANGYIMGAIPTVAQQAAVHYGIVLDYASANGTPASNMTGLPAAEAYENVKLFTSEGKVEILGTNFKLAADGVTISEYIATGIKGTATNGICGLAAGANGKLVQYTLTSDGKIASITLATDTAGLNSAHTKGQTFEVVSSGDKDYATNGTVVFMLKSGASPYTYTGVNDIVVFTGYANVPTDTYTAGDAIAADASKGSEGALTVKIATLPGSNTDAQFAILLGAPVVTKGITATYRYTWDALVNGELTTVFAEGSSDSFSTHAYKLCNVTFNSKTGAIASLTPVSADIDQIVTVASGYYADNELVYIDANTVFYQLDAASIGAGSISGIYGYSANGITLPGSGDTFQVYEYYVVKGADGIADVVFYFVYQP